MQVAIVFVLFVLFVYFVYFVVVKKSRRSNTDPSVRVALSVGGTVGWPNSAES